MLLTSVRSIFLHPQRGRRAPRLSLLSSSIAHPRSKRCIGARGRSALCAIAITLPLIAQIAVPGAASGSAAKCADVFILGARGSGEPAGYGTAVGDSVEIIRAKLGELGVPTKAVAVQYPAVGIAWAAVTYATYRAYDDSVRQGVAEIKLELGSYLARCSGRVILLGYSQGADVMTRGLDEIWAEPRYAPLHRRLAAVALFGSPQFQPHLRVDADTGYTGNLKGIAYSIPFFHHAPRLPNTAATTGSSYCLPGDPVCGFDSANVVYSCAYFSGPACPHYHYGDAIAEAAGRRAVSLVLGRRCGRVAFAPQSDNLASDIRAAGVTCGVARRVAEIARRYPVALPGTVDRYDTRGFACAGRSKQPPSGMSVAYYHCSRGSALLTFVRSGAGKFP